MGRINLQFHGTKKEIIEYAKECLMLYDLFMVCIQLIPEYVCEIVNKNELNDKKKALDNSQIICLFRFKPNTTPKKYLDFINMNSDLLIFSIGQQDETIIKESMISTTTTDDVTFKKWKCIVNDFKKNMLKGAWVVNPQNGAKKYCENHRYTYSAKKAFEDGIKIGAFAGWCLYILQEDVTIDE